MITVSLTVVTDKNLYGYCDYNPVMRKDLNGEFWHIVIGAGLNLGFSWLSAYVTGQEFTIADGLLALVTGGLSSVTDGYQVAALINGLYAGGKSLYEGRGLGQSLLSAGIGVASSMCTLDALPKSMKVDDKLTCKVFDIVFGGFSTNFVASGLDLLIKEDYATETQKPINRNAYKKYSTYGNSSVTRSAYQATARYVI